jgi:F-box and WD-40 domain protein CDC4
VHYSECLALLTGHTSLVGQLQLTNSILVTGGSDGRVIIFDLSTFECLYRLCAHDNSVTCLQFDDRFIVSGGNDGRVKLWDLRSGAFVRELTKPCEAVWRVTFKDDKCVVLLKRAGKTVMEASLSLLLTPWLVLELISSPSVPASGSDLPSG